MGSVVVVMSKRLTAVLLLLVLFGCMVCGCDSVGSAASSESGPGDSQTSLSSEAVPDPLFGRAFANSDGGSPTTENSALLVHFIDVGQANAVLVQSGGMNMLVDGGEAETGAELVAYLRSCGVASLDYLVTTHPHADHIGGLPAVLDTIPVEEIIMPRVQTQTLIFEKLLLKIKEKGLSITAPVVGTSYSLGSAEFVVLGPVDDYGDRLNDWSVALRIVNGEDSFLLCGDAESAAERDIVVRWGDGLASDVLLVNHHGSNSSSSQRWLDAVKPDYAVISVGAGNSYGHPSDVVLERLAAMDVAVYRTDELGTILCESSGRGVSFRVGVKVVEEESGAVVVFVTNTGGKYHAEGCRFLAGSKMETLLEAAKESGYEPCGTCNPLG